MRVAHVNNVLCDAAGLSTLSLARSVQSLAKMNGRRASPDCGTVNGDPRLDGSRRVEGRLAGQVVAQDHFKV